MRIESIKALETIDSRGNPTVTAQVTLAGGVSAIASVPSGASTGSREALELRDGDKSRFLGKGVQKAVDNVNQKIAPALIGLSALEQKAVDQKMLDLDGTDNKANLGANAILGVSMAVARAAAAAQNIPLYRHIEALYGKKAPLSFPIPMMNVINGGAHADNPLNIQEFMIQPFGFERFVDALRAGCEIFHHLKTLLHKRGLATAVGDEGGFAPNIASTEAALELLVEAIKTAGYDPKTQVGIALDMASSEFFKDKKYTPESDQASMDSEGMIAYIKKWTEKYNIRSVEDGLAEGDWDGWAKLTAALGQKVQLVGDDLFVTNPKIFKEGIDKKIANAILIKLNQIGSVSETLDCIGMAKASGYNAIISHRSGETSDTFIADLAVGTGAGQIKTGSLSRSDRVEKYNRLLLIGGEISAPYAKAKFIS